MDKLFDFELTGELLQFDFVQTALLAAAILGLLAGVLGPLIVSRNMAFAVHGTSELSFTGGAAALLLGINVGHGALAGAIVAALMLGLLSRRSSEHDSVIGAVLAFGLGVGVLLLWFYPGRAANKFGLLVGQIVGVDFASLALLGGCAVAVILVLLAIYRPLLFASVDPEVARARGVPVRLLSIGVRGARRRRDGAGRADVGRAAGAGADDHPGRRGVPASPRARCVPRFSRSCSRRWPRWAASCSRSRRARR